MEMNLREVQVVTCDRQEPREQEQAGAQVGQASRQPIPMMQAGLFRALVSSFMFVQARPVPTLRGTSGHQIDSIYP